MSFFFIVLAIVCGMTLFPKPAYADDNVAVYRLYDENTGEHFFTQSIDEANTLTNIWWTFEYVDWGTPAVGTTPVYRLYNPSCGGHMYTADINEYNSLPSHGWKQEGIVFYGVDGGKPIYRLYDPNNHSVISHHFTSDKAEYDALPAYGWIQEGIAWYSPEAPATYTELNPYPPKPQPSPEDLFAAEWAPRIDAYNYGWPLYGYGDTFARAAYAYGMDPRVAPAIARVESGSGRIPLYRYGAGNCWGWMSYLGDDFGTAIWNYCQKFSRGYGSTLTPGGAAAYCPGNSGYYWTVQNEMSKI